MTLPLRLAKWVAIWAGVLVAIVLMAVFLPDPKRKEKRCRD